MDQLGHQAGEAAGRDPVDGRGIAWSKGVETRTEYERPTRCSGAERGVRVPTALTLVGASTRAALIAFRPLPFARTCPVDHGTGSRSRVLIEAR